MFSWFKSEYTKSLERQLAEIRQEQDARIAEIKTAHADELSYVKKELDWHKEESERLRRFFSPTMQVVYDQISAAQSPDAPQTPPDPYANMSPFQRMVARDWEQQGKDLEEANRQKKLKAEDAAKAAEAAKTEKAS